MKFSKWEKQLSQFEPTSVVDTSVLVKYLLLYIEGISNSCCYIEGHTICCYIELIFVAIWKGILIVVAI